ncbi:uncharacterized protein LOC131284953 [Anopheles ziemanni]|uniref:uncharacterized protein LOC131284953 n=1 Tax=Anopheles ziemanni TaxID=345580 RepID=UPI00265FE449|nr:uncharacterized protein LOC131284953 [Anopheles ziemanni]
MESAFRIVGPAFVLLLFLLGPEQAVRCQDSCRTPDHRDGICRSLKQCSSIYNEYFESDRVLTQDEIEFLQQLKCKTNEVTICCPDGVTTSDRNLTSERGSLPDPKEWKCGLDTLSDRIIGGNATALDEFPWYALLQYRSKKGTLAFNCGGSLINSRYVLTAAHCLANKKIDDGETLVSVRLGEHNTATERDCVEQESDSLEEDCADPPQNFGIEEQIVHPGYDKNGKYQHNDIALIRLDKDAQINNYVQPVCLPTSNFIPTAPNVNITVVGFGHTGRQRHSGIKLKAMIPIYPRAECEKKWAKANLIEQQLCAGGIFGIDSCSGDSGGPLMVRRLYWIQEGVISYGNQCALEDWPGIYTRVSSYIDWIKETIRLESPTVKIMGTGVRSLLPSLVLPLFLCGSLLDVSRVFASEEEAAWDPVRLCDIPNEEAPGECRPPGECEAYGKINHVSNLSSIARFSFIKQIQCNGSEPVPYVCCPRNSHSYREPYVKETDRSKDRASSWNSIRSDDSCGIRTTVMIRGGQLAELDEFPWMAMLLYERENNTLVQGCGGALISRTYVLTAAHCVTGRNFEQQKGRLKFVRLREYNIHTNPDCVYEDNLKDCSDDKIDMEPKEVIPHPDYNSDSSNQQHDIALIKIERTPPFDDFLRAICLPMQNFEDTNFNRILISVSGWGRTGLFKNDLGPNVLSPIKLKLSLPYVERNSCSKAFQPWKFMLGPGQMCAGGEHEKDTCSGDSGSPLMSYDFKRAVWNITGIVSLGVRDCGVAGLPGVYTYVYHYLPWIRTYMPSWDD